MYFLFFKNNNIEINNNFCEKITCDSNLYEHIRKYHIEMEESKKRRVKMEADRAKMEADRAKMEEDIAEYEKTYYDFDDDPEKVYAKKDTSFYNKEEAILKIKSNKSIKKKVKVTTCQNNCNCILCIWK